MSEVARYRLIAKELKKYRTEEQNRIDNTIIWAGLSTAEQNKLLKQSRKLEGSKKKTLS